MSVKVLIAHAKGEEALAERLAGAIRQAGYEAAHEGTVLVGESVTAEVSKLLSEGAPVVLCGTVRAVGTKWARRVVNAARGHKGVRVFVVQMEEEADTDTVSFDEVIARYWQDPAKAEQDLVAALCKYYPLDADARQVLQQQDLESRYRQLALKACDIIDLANLPEDDRHLATRELELRRLYVALRMRVEVAAGAEVDDKALEALERRRASTWGKGPVSWKPDERKPVSLGERLQEARRLVVLGDPGAGKSTLLRWLATAYLLRLQRDPDWQALPDVATLPDAGWLPILVRCRDLPPGSGTLDEMLHHTLRKAELAEDECRILRALLRTRLEQGEALLLVDGLDEITEPRARARFARQLERIHSVLPKAPMVVTSRIVGYREMGYRIRSGFEHLTVADLSREDKDDFARRWCDLTERAERREAAAAELIRDIHSSDRIERLTGNPMLLTTMALIKRKIGRLPQRRVELYEKAVEVLLNWRSEVDTPLDKREALPQLEYLAYAMCDQGVQRLRQDEVLDLLRRMRDEYPQVHPLKEHSPEDFLDLLERRTGLLIQSGHTRHHGASVPVYEFRHLTFQEYLAGLALVQGHFPGRDRDRSLAENIAPLAGRMRHAHFGEHGLSDAAVTENWREALRLCVAACNDDDVDAAIRAILTPIPGEERTARPRAVLAGLCLADEPNASDAVAREVLHAFAAQVGERDGSGSVRTSLDTAALELAASRWEGLLSEFLMEEFFRRESEKRTSTGGLRSMVLATKAPQEGAALASWLAEQAAVLPTAGEHQAAEIALTVMDLAYKRNECRVPGMVSGLNRAALRQPAREPCHGVGPGVDERANGPR